MAVLRGQGAIVVRLLLLAAAAITVSATLLGHDSAQALDPGSSAKELVSLTNVSRTSNGLSSLLVDERLRTVAVARSEDMITREDFSHSIPPDNRTVVDLMESLGVRMRSAGENIAWNNALDFSTVQEASSDFMNSHSHRENVLSQRWQRLGAGVAQGKGRQMYTVVFMQVPSDEVRPGQSPGNEAAPRGASGATGPAEAAQVRSAPSGLMDNLVSQSLRLFLNL